MVGIRGAIGNPVIDRMHDWSAGASRFGLIALTLFGIANVGAVESRVRTGDGRLWLEVRGTTNARVDVLTQGQVDGVQWQPAGHVYLHQGAAEVELAVGEEMGFFQVTEDLEDVKPAEDPAGLVWCRAGTFTMGSAEDETRPNLNWHMVSEVPATVVTLTQGFWIGAYELTQREYLDVVGNNPSYFTNAPNHLDLPADRLTWNQASNYCALLTRRERQAGRLPEGYTYRLPTEAEWEYACRAGTTNRFYFGDYPDYWNRPGATPLGEHSWYYQNSKKTVHPPGEKLPNPWGLYDLYGNVCEWVIDHAAPYPGGHVTNYVATSAINIRGQSFTNAAPAPWSTMSIYRSGNWNDTDLRGQGSPARIAGWRTTFWQNLGLRIVLGPVLPGVWTYRGE